MSTPREGRLAAMKRFVDAFNRRDLDAVRDDLTPDVELHEWPEAVGARSYSGPDGLQRALDTWFDAWEWMKVEITDVDDIPDGFLVTLHQRAKGKGSAVEVELDSYNIYTFEGLKVKSMKLFTDRDDALVAAGLQQDSEEARR
jgi:ketosteroid isomerase-like protein